MIIGCKKKTFQTGEEKGEKSKEELKNIGLREGERGQYPSETLPPPETFSPPPLRQCTLL